MKLTSIRSGGYEKVQAKFLLEDLQNKRRNPFVSGYVLSDQQHRIMLEILEDLLGK